MVYYEQGSVGPWWRQGWAANMDPDRESPLLGLSRTK